MKRNRIICPRLAVNGQFLPGKSKFFMKLPEKSKFFENLPGKIDFFKLPEKTTLFENLPGKIDFLPGSTNPRSNQIDAAEGLLCMSFFSW